MVAMDFSERAIIEVDIHVGGHHDGGSTRSRCLDGWVTVACHIFHDTVPPKRHTWRIAQAKKSSLEYPGHDI
jgi:hypothetical protein